MLRDEIEFPGIESSPAFARQPEGKGVAEEALRKGLAELRNAPWRRERHGRKPPSQIRAGQKALASEAATEFKSAAQPAQYAVS